MSGWTWKNDLIKYCMHKFWQQWMRSKLSFNADGAWRYCPWGEQSEGYIVANDQTLHAIQHWERIGRYFRWGLWAGFLLLPEIWIIGAAIMAFLFWRQINIIHWFRISERNYMHLFYQSLIGMLEKWPLSVRVICLIFCLFMMGLSCVELAVSYPYNAGLIIGHIVECAVYLLWAFFLMMSSIRKV